MFLLWSHHEVCKSNIWEFKVGCMHNSSSGFVCFAHAVFVVFKAVLTVSWILHYSVHREIIHIKITQRLKVFAGYRVDRYKVLCHKMVNKQLQSLLIKFPLATDVQLHVITVPALLLIVWSSGHFWADLVRLYNDQLKLNLTLLRAKLYSTFKSTVTVSNNSILYALNINLFNKLVPPCNSSAI